MKLKFLTILCTVCSLAQISAIADGSAVNNVAFKGNTVVISGTASGKTVTAKVLPSSADEESYADAFAVKEAEITEDGTFEFSFVMPDERGGSDTTGAYKVYVNFGDGEVISKSFDFVNSVQRADVLAKLKTINGEQIKAVLQDAENKTVLTVMGIELDEYEALGTNKEKSITLLLKESNLSAMSESGVSDAINKAVDIISLEKCGAEKAEKHLSDINTVYDGVSYNQIKLADQKTWVKGYVIGKVYASYADYENMYRDANALYMVNNARYSDLDTLVKENDKTFGLLSDSVYGKYTAMTATKQRTVNEKVVVALKANKADTPEEFARVYREKIEEVAKQPNTSGGGSSGGGGGGGGSSKRETMSVPANPEAVKPAGNTAVNNETKPIFADIAGFDWAKEAIGALKDKNIISGYSDGTFMPEKAVNREEFVKMLVLAMGEKETAGETAFSDVPSDAWYAPFISTAVSKGIVNGVTENEFGIGSSITRQQMAVMAYRAYGGEITAVREYEGFADEASIDDYAKEAVIALYRAGKINGVGENAFAPQKVLTRAEAAKIIYEIFCR